MKELTTIEMVNEFIQENKFSFVYVSRTHCSVCHALLPQVKEVLSQFSLINQGYINADQLEEIAGRLSIFTVPVLLLFIDGKETIREARFVPIETFEEKVRKVYQLYNAD
ncbi:thioredoxin family protein [Alkalihalophilus marmarensis]|uniref:thioredoxin family protein n=1 Tax=Alkalihalophilus marmarensis TaxID=521377 RepID=UPI002E1DAE64|nr:thioredoxin family protein [Alkalihalophilus marmarensis]